MTTVHDEPLAGEPADTTDYSMAFAPDPEHDAWWAGFTLGMEGLDAEAPAGLPADLKAAFDRGYWGGYDGFIGGREEAMMEHEAWLDAIDARFPDWHEAELAEAGIRPNYVA